MAVNASILKAVVSFFRIGSDIAFECHKGCIPDNDINTLLAPKKNPISFLGSKEVVQ